MRFVRLLCNLVHIRRNDPHAVQQWSYIFRVEKVCVGTAHRHVSYVGGRGGAALLSLALYFFVFSLVERDLLLFYFLVLSCDSYRSFRFDLIELTARFEG